MAGVLYIVATPIGNLEDITLRAIRVLKEADLIACEDTRQTQKLLNHYGIEKKTVSYHEHNELTRAAELVKDLEEGMQIAVVSDAGMPGISDPGYRLVSLAVRHRIPVVPIPGASAFVAVLGSSRQVVVAREVTKMHEEFLRGRADEVLEQLQARAEVKGEIVLMIARATEVADVEPDPKNIAARVRELQSAEQLDEKDALKRAAKEFGVSKSEAYRELQRTK